MTSRIAALFAVLLLVGFAGRAPAQVPDGFVEYGVYFPEDSKRQGGWRVAIGKDQAMFGYASDDKRHFGLILPRSGAPTAGIVESYAVTWSDGTRFDVKVDWTGVRGTFDGTTFSAEGVRADEGHYFSKPANSQATSNNRLRLKVRLTFSESGACKVEGEDEELEAIVRFANGKVDKVTDLIKHRYTACARIGK